MTPRRVETLIARFTLVLLCLYAPVETWVSLPAGLSNPFYLVDVAGFGLLLWGALASLRARPDVAPGVLPVLLQQLRAPFPVRGHQSPEGSFAHGPIIGSLHDQGQPRSRVGAIPKELHATQGRRHVVAFFLGQGRRGRR